MNDRKKQAPGVKSLYEIKHYQKRWKLLIKKRPFQRLVREIGQYFKSSLNWQKGAHGQPPQQQKGTLFV